MFIEQSRKGEPKTGWIEIIAGSMFSGKTEELIRRMRRAEFAKQSVEIFKPSIDTRYSNEEVISHNQTSILSTPVDNSSKILLFANNIDVVGIDEAQFFDEGIVEVAIKLANNGTRVIVAGLDMDFLGRPFGPMPQFFAVAEYITKVHAICVRCGEIAQYSYRRSDSNKIVLLGEKDIYEPLCRRCYNEVQKK
ncbi:MAG: thymidine kinase [Bacteroidales bacterium]|jgi:thymidine kinase|nr:thymidine kinase [Bacteroidales bacterium]